MIKSKYPFYLANLPVYTNQHIDVYDKYSLEKVGCVSIAGKSHVRKAIESVDNARGVMKNMPAYKRQEILQQCMSEFVKRKDELAKMLCVEVGKPIKDARGEVLRLIETFKIASEESTRLYGEVIPMDVNERGVGYTGICKRVPRGPVTCITPFNFPLNLIAHKIAPAIAAGCPFILKPALNTPISAMIVGEVLSETELPKGSFSILTCSNEDASSLVTDDRMKLLSFTGSQTVGWELKAKAGQKQVVLELGENAGCIVDCDVEIDKVVEKVVAGGFSQSGQSCISVQRVYVHRAIYNEFKEQLVEKVKKIRAGNPREEETIVGPLISEKEARRVEEWVVRAKADGAKVVCGGKREGAIFWPSVLENVNQYAEVYREEVFGPIMILEGFDDIEQAVEKVNDSSYGLQAGVFTTRIDKVVKLWDKLDVGAVMINEVPTWRLDHMPYGGVKKSGIGREGVRYAIENMTERKLLVIGNS